MVSYSEVFISILNCTCQGDQKISSESNETKLQKKLTSVSNVFLFNSNHGKSFFVFVNPYPANTKSDLPLPPV